MPDAAIERRTIMRPRQLLAVVVPLCLLLVCVGAWQLQQKNRAWSKAEAGISKAPESLLFAPQSEARALYLKGRHLWNARSDKKLIKSEEYYKRG